MENKLTEKKFKELYVTKYGHVNGCCATDIRYHKEISYLSYTRADGFMIESVGGSTTSSLYTAKNLQDYSVLIKDKDLQEVAPNFFRYIKTQSDRIHYSEMGYEVLKKGEWLVDVSMKSLVKSFLNKLELEYEISEGTYESNLVSVYARKDSKYLYLYKCVKNGDKIIFRVKNSPFTDDYSTFFDSSFIKRSIKNLQLTYDLIQKEVITE